MSEVYWGVSAQRKNASIVVFSKTTNSILFAGLAEHFSKIKNDPELNAELVAAALAYGYPKIIFWGDNYLATRFHQLIVGEAGMLSPKSYLKRFPSLAGIKIKTVSRHRALAAGAYYTAKFTDASIIVIDNAAYGTALSIWCGDGKKLKCVYTKRYPNSLGRFATAVSERTVGYPSEEFLQIASYGKPIYKSIMVNTFFDNTTDINFTVNENLLESWPTFTLESQKFDLAATAQSILEDIVGNVAAYARSINSSRNLVYAGSLAHNVVLNTELASIGLFDRVWIDPHPCNGSLGSVLQHTKLQLVLKTLFLGHEIISSDTVDDVIDSLLTKGIAISCFGKTEFSSHRGLGNRSILVDPNNENAVHTLRRILRKSASAVFPCVVADDNLHDNFILPSDIISPFMQFTGICKFESMPSIRMINGCAIIQTVNQSYNSRLYEILDIWTERTGNPILINAPLLLNDVLVNSDEDLRAFKKQFNLDK